MTRTDAALLERAAHQDVHYDERSERGYQQALLADAARAVNCELARCRHFKRNRNADLYLLPAADRTWVLKILTSKPVETLECEYAALKELATIAGEAGTFRVPAPGPLFEGRSAYLVEHVAGRPFHLALIDGRFDAPGATAAAGEAGAALASIHRAWAAPSGALDVAAFVADLEHLPFAPSAVEAATLARLAAALQAEPVGRARLYLDFDPVNILLEPGRPPLLLDPPERVAVDAVTWDLGTFLFGMRRAAWRWPPAARRLAALQPDLRAAFLEGYTAGVPGGGPGALLLETGELVRLGQLWRWWMNPLGFRRRALGLARSAYAWPLLRAARRERFAELRRLLETP